MPKHQSAKAPRLAHVFWPLRIQPSPRRVARGARADAGQVAAGVGLGPALAPDLVARRHRREVARLLGRRSRTRAWWGRAGRCRSGSPAWGRGRGSTPPRTRATRRSRRRARRTRRASSPPTSGPRTWCAPRRRWASKPAAVSSEGRGSAGTCAASQARASARKASCSALKVRSMAEGIFHSAPGRAKVAGRGCGVRVTASAGRAGAWCSTSVRTKKSTTACDDLRPPRATSPTVSNSCPPSYTVTSWWGTPSTAEVPGQLHATAPGRRSRRCSSRG